MARSKFGGTSDDYVFYTVPFGVNQVVSLGSSVTLTFWNAASGGTRYTDLLLNGSPVTTVTTSGGWIPEFQGPDGITEMYADSGATTRGVLFAQGQQGPTGPAGPSIAAWAAATAYTAGQVVSVGTVLYQSNDTHTSAGTWAADSSHWTAIGPVASVVGQSGVVTGSQIATDPALSATYVPLSSPTKDAPALGLFFPEAHGAAGDGVTDDTTAINNTIAAAQSAGGGTVWLADKTYLCLGAITPAYTGSGTSTLQKPVRITSAAMAPSGGFNGFWNTNPLNGGAVLDLRYAGAGGTPNPAKIDTRGAGFAEMDHITMVSGGTDDYLFFQTTNTTVDIHHCSFIGHTANSGTACVQDAIAFGGSSSVTIGNGAGAPFQGYGSKVHDNYFSHIRRGFIGRVYCNSIPVENNTFSTTCGNSTGGAIEFHGDDGSLGGQLSAGCSTRGNTIEVTNYKYGIAAYYTTMASFGPDGFFDASGPYTAAVYIDATSIYNNVVDGFRSDVYPLVIDPGFTTTTTSSHQSQPSIKAQVQRFTSPTPNIAVSPQNKGMYVTSPQGAMAAIGCNNGNHPYPEAVLATDPAVQVSDGVTTSGSAVVTSATAGWQALDVGMPIQGAGIPANTVILSRQSASQVTMSANATATATGVTITFGRGAGTSGNDEIGVSRRHIISKGSIGTASLTAGPAAGTGATVSASGTDTAFTLTLNTGTGPTTGAMTNVGAGINWAAVPKVVLTPKNLAAATAMQTNQVYVTNTTSNFTLNVGVALPASTTFIWDVHQVQ